MCPGSYHLLSTPANYLCPKIQIEQRIFSLLLCESFTYYVRHRNQSIFILDSGRNGHRAGPLHNAHPAMSAVGQWLIDILAMVRSYINKLRAELLEFVDYVINLINAVPFKRGRISNEKTGLGLSSIISIILFICPGGYVYLFHCIFYS